MNVLLCSVYSLDKRDIVRGGSWENLGIRYIGAALSDLDNVNVVLHDNHFHCRSNEEAIDLYQSGPAPDIVGISFPSHKLRLGLDLARRIRQVAPSVKIALGGCGPTFWKETILKEEPAVDVIFLGDGEITFREFVKRIRDNADWRETPGIVFPHNGELVENPMAEMASLDSLKTPIREPHYPLKQCIISASRGCVYNCTFCSIILFYRMQPGKKIRYRNPKLLVDEMEMLQKQHGIRWINFTDDDFLGINRISPGWSDQIAEEIIRRKLDLRFFIQTRADNITEETLARLKKAGLYVIGIGVEACVPRMLQSLNKKATVEQNRKAMQIIRKLEIDYALYSIFIDADSTIPEILENVDGFKSLGYYDSHEAVPFSMQITDFRGKVYAYRGTHLFSSYLQRGILKINGFRIDYDVADPLVSELAKICRVWNERWNDVSSIVLQRLALHAIRLGMTREADYFRRIHNQYFELDTRWLKLVCHSLVMNNGRCDKELETINREISPGLKELRDDLKKHKDLIARSGSKTIYN